ncbi:MAG: type II toxin-antitoxin system VapC family toxin [Anaerolineae bacterium]|nr:type II toxin-antitoxin system VapC family toxin [Anaerolineae bacterium]
MSAVVLDSGIFIASVYPETLTIQAKNLLKRLQASKTVFHAPSLLRYEMIAVSRKAVYQKRVTAEEGLTARDILLSYPITLHIDEALLKRGYEIATQFERPTAYDSQYLALAERLDYPFWTADERLFNAITSKLPNVFWLGNLSAEPMMTPLNPTD